MQFSVTTTEKNGLIQACERNTSAGVAGISGNATLLAEFTNYLNEASREVWHLIFTSYGGWQYEDGNQTDLPSSTTTLTASQTTYALPSGSLTVRGVEVKDAGGVWTGLHPITEEQIRTHQAESEFYKTAGAPLFYRLIGQTLKIYPASNYTQTASLKVNFDRGSVAFLTTDTTATPGFASEYHDILAVKASIKWLTNKRPADATLPLLLREEDKKNKQLKEFYATKFSQMFPPRLTVRDQLSDYL